MSAVELAPEQIHGIAPIAQGTTGDSASPEAIRKLSHQLAHPTLNAKTQTKALEKLKASLMAIRAGDFDLGGRRAMDALKMDETNGLGWHVLAILAWTAFLACMAGSGCSSSSAPRRSC